MSDTWYRPELEGEELVTPQEFDEIRGFPTSGTTNRLRSYADIAPGIVRQKVKKRYYSLKELNDFVDVISRMGSRTPEEKTRAEVAYWARRVEELQGSVDTAEAAVAKSRKNVERSQDALQKKQRVLSDVRTEMRIAKKNLDNNTERLTLLTEDGAAEQG